MISQKSDDDKKVTNDNRYLFVIALLTLLSVSVALFSLYHLSNLKDARFALRKAHERNDKLKTVLTNIDDASRTLHDSLDVLQYLDDQIPASLKKSLHHNVTVHTAKSEAFDFPFITFWADTMEYFLKEYSSHIYEEHEQLKNIPIIPPIPFSHEFVIERHFGVMKDPFTGKESPHNGVDYAAVLGTPVQATADGEVTRAYTHRLWGKKIEISHGSGIKTVYAHLGTITIPHGKWVKKGDVIGTIGASGWSTGNHVHYEIIVNGKKVDALKFQEPQDIWSK